MAIFERSPELTSRLLPQIRPADSPEEIIGKARAIVATLGERERIAILDAHPRIGDDVRALSELSLREQGSGQDEATRADLVSLNAAYERKFGFRFVVFVAGRSKTQILPVLRERLGRSREQELVTGLEEFLRISLDRLGRATR